jgi:putative DNA primase/helicase
VTGTVERARGRWREILPQLGIAASFLRNRHGPCPLCGGKDRFRFDDRAGSGSYICNQCGPGPGLMLLRKLNDWDHRTACDAVDRIIRADYRPPAPQPAAPSNANRKALIRRTIAEATDQGVVDAYLARRGLGVSSLVLLGHPACPYFDDDTKRMIGRYPAVIAPITAPDGEIESAHRIYDAALDPRKKSLPPVRTIKGAAVRLHEPTDDLGIGEGIETCLAAFQMFNIPVWAALTEGGLAAFEPPPGIATLHIFGDADLNYVGQAAAYALAKRAHHAGLNVEVHIPPRLGSDWLDVLNEGGRT